MKKDNAGVDKKKPKVSAAQIRVQKGLYPEGHSSHSEQASLITEKTCPTNQLD